MLVGVDDVPRLISQSLSLGERIDQRLGFNGTQPLIEALVEEVVTGLADDEISDLVEVPRREVADQFALGFADHLFTKIPDGSTRNRGKGVVDGCVKLYSIRRWKGGWNRTKRV